jgi:hypothetical protein
MKFLARHKVALGLAAAMLILSFPIPALSNSGLAFLMSFVVPATLLWILYAVVMLVRRTGRIERLGRLAIWIPTFALAMTAMNYKDSAAREQASAIASAVSAHKARTGAYPGTLREVGHDSDELRSRMSLAYRVDPDGKAALFYSQPSMPTVAHHYDFAAGTWQRQH